MLSHKRCFGAFVFPAILLWLVLGPPLAARQADTAKRVAPAGGAEPQAAGQAMASPPQVVPALPVPRLVKFSGVVQDAAGEPATAGGPRTGLVGITFSIYAEQRGGTTLWMETHNVELDAQGRYSVLLGSQQSEGMPLELFASGEPRWLGVKVELPGEVEQARVLLVSVPYALKASDADTLGGRPASAFVLARSGEAATEAATGPNGTGAGKASGAAGVTAATIGGSGTVNQLAKFTPDGMTIGSSSITEVNGNVGVGVTPPANQRLVIAVPANEIAMNMSNLADQDLVVSVSSPGAADKVGIIGPTTPTNLALQVGGSEKVRITNAGDVGIGVVPPSITPHQRLAIGVPAGDIALNMSNLVDQDLFVTVSAPGAADKVGIIGPGTPSNLGLQVGGFEKVRITNAGAVGIGTKTPSQALEVVGSAKISGTGNGLIFPDATMQTTAATISAVNTPAGGGLMGGTASGAANLSLLNTCGSGQVLQWNGTAWVCATVSSAAGVTSIMAGTGLTGTPSNPITSTGTVAIDPAVVPQLAANNTFTGNNTFSGSLTLNALALPNTTSSSVGVISFGGTPFVHDFGSSNTFVGASAGNFGVAGANNTAVGASALLSDGGGFSNSAFGSSALSMNLKGAENSAFGVSALQLNTVGNDNSAFGLSALSRNTAGSANSAFGRDALFSNTMGANNSAFGLGALGSLMTGNSNIAIGFNAGSNLSAGESNNIYLGNPGVANESQTIRIGDPTVHIATYIAGGLHFPDGTTQTTAFTAGSGGTITGQEIFTAAPTGAGVSQGSVYIDPPSAVAGQTLFGAAVGGVQEMVLDSGGNLTLSGRLALPTATSGGTAGVITLGGFPFLHNFGQVILGSSANAMDTFVGQNAGNLKSTNIGTANTGFGGSALSSNTSGYGNTASGASALASNTTGTYNTAVGVSAGLTANSANANTTGSFNTFIGASAGPGSSTQLTNAAAIGANAMVNCNNCMVLGDSTMPMNVGIGTNTPSQALEVVGSVKATSFIGSGTSTFTGQDVFTAVPTGSGAGQGSVYINPASAGAGQTLLGAAVGGNQKMLLDSSGTLTLSGSLALPATSATGGTPTAGVITLGGSPFIHSYFPFGLDTFVGALAGNFTMTSGSNTGIGGLALSKNATGVSNTATGAQALQHNISGNSNTASGQGSLLDNVSGSGNTAVGYGAGQSPMESNANTTGSNNTFIGYFSGPGVPSASNLQNATAIGANAVVNCSNCVVLGDSTMRMRVGIGTPSPLTPLHVIDSGNVGLRVQTNTVGGTVASFGGNGDFQIDAPGIAGGRFTVAENGYVGIGSVSPSAQLEIVGSQPAAVPGNGIGANFVLTAFGGKGGNTTGTTSQVAGIGGPVSILAGDGGDAPAGSLNGNGGTITIAGGRAGAGPGAPGSPGNVILVPPGSGLVGIGTYTPDNTLTVNGSADKPGGGSWGTFSDGRLKNVEGTFSAGLDQILQLHPIRYRYKEENALGIKDHEEHIGFVAQDVEKVIPEAVSTDGEGYRILNADPILWAMLNAIQQQQKEIAALRAQVKAQAEEVAEVAPDLVARNRDGEIETVFYDKVNAMLLNEVQKQRRLLQEHGRASQEQQRVNEQQRSTISRQQGMLQEQRERIEHQQAEMQALAARLARLEALTAAKP